MYPVTVRDEPARHVLGLAHAGPYPEVGPVFETVAAAIWAAGLWLRAQGGVMIAFDDPGATPPERPRSFAGVIVPAHTPCPQGLHTHDLAAGRHAVLEMTGPYAGLAAAWAWLYGPWMARAGARPGPGPAFEIYRNHPGETPPEALRTDLFAPLA